MTLQQLSYFVATCEHGSFSAAAESLHLAQPSLSQQVRRLEAELGVALFQRVGRGLVSAAGGPHPAGARADDARRRRCTTRGGRCRARGSCGHRDVRHVGDGALLPRHRDRRRVPATPSGRASAHGRPELGGGRQRRPHRGARGGDDRPADRRHRPRRAPDHGRRGRLRQHRPRAGAAADDDRAPRGRAADPARRQLGRHRPHAPPARRARAARRDPHRAADRRRGRGGGGGARGPGTR